MVQERERERGGPAWGTVPALDAASQKRVSSGHHWHYNTNRPPFSLDGVVGRHVLHADIQCTRTKCAHQSSHSDTSS